MHSKNVSDIPEILVKTAACCFGGNDLTLYNDCGEALRGKKKILRRILRAVKKEQYKGTRSVKRLLCALLLLLLLFAVLLLYTLPVLSLLGINTGALSKLDIISSLSGTDTFVSTLSTPVPLPEPKLPAGTERLENARHTAAYSVMYRIGAKSLYYTRTAVKDGQYRPTGDYHFSVLVSGKKGTAAVFEGNNDSDRYCTVFWADGGFSYSLSGAFPIEELVKYAQSIYE